MQDDILLKKLYDRDKDTFEYIMESYNRFLWTIVGGILSNVGSYEDIEECICDVYIKLWENPRAFNPQRGSLKTFLAVIAKSLALNKYRQLSKIKISELKSELRSNDDDLLEYIMNKETCGRLYEAIDSLKEPDKEIMVRRYFFEEKPAAIASKISISVKEVENRLYQGKLRMKKFLTRKEGFAYEE